jgi:hypothetical protein
MPTSLCRFTLSAAFTLAVATAGSSVLAQDAPAPQSAGLRQAQTLPDAPSAVSARTAATLVASDDSAYSSSTNAELDPVQAPGQTPSQSKDPALPETTDKKPGQAPEPGGKQTKRILGIVPNFRSVSADVKLPPMSVKEKFIEASQDNFDYSSIFLPAAVATEEYLRDATPEFGSGGVAYGRYLWHAVVDQTSENYFVEFIVPAITHEDPRFYTLGHGTFKKRAVYSLTRVFVTRTDGDRETFNASEIVGASLSAALSNAYYPSAERTLSNTGQQIGTSVGIDALTFLFKEFWPDINDSLSHHKR